MNPLAVNPLDARTLAAVADLELIARMIVDGFMFGSHPSRMQGTGVEFSQYRSYQAGDDLRRVDWKLFARSDRYFVRESEAETSVTIRVILDATDSMRAAEDGVSRFDYGRMLAAALALIAFRQGDALGLALIRDGRVEATRPDRGRPHLNRLLHRLSAAVPAGVWPGWRELEGPVLGGISRGVTLVITDLSERASEIRGALRKLAALRHDVGVLHLTGRRELEFDYHGDVTFEEAETGRTMDVATDEARLRYVQSLAASLRELELELGEQRIAYRRIRLDEPLDVALARALAARARL